MRVPHGPQAVTEQAVSEWLIGVIPPELGPWLQLAAAHFDVFRPAAIIASALFLVVVVQVARWVLPRLAEALAR